MVFCQDQQRSVILNPYLRIYQGFSEIGPLSSDSVRLNYSRPRKWFLGSIPPSTLLTVTVNDFWPTAGRLYNIFAEDAIPRYPPSSLNSRYITSIELSVLSLQLPISTNKKLLQGALQIVRILAFLKHPITRNYHSFYLDLSFGFDSLGRTNPLNRPSLSLIRARSWLLLVLWNRPIVHSDPVAFNPPSFS